MVAQKSEMIDFPINIIEFVILDLINFDIGFDSISLIGLFINS